MILNLVDLHVSYKNLKNKQIQTKEKKLLHTALSVLHLLRLPASGVCHGVGWQSWSGPEHEGACTIHVK